MTNLTLSTHLALTDPYILSHRFGQTTPAHTLIRPPSSTTLRGPSHATREVIVTNLPGTFTRPQIIAAFDALDLDDDDIVGLEITGTEINLELNARDVDGDLVHLHGEIATVIVTIPIDG